jgi:hypothetical protein
LGTLCGPLGPLEVSNVSLREPLAPRYPGRPTVSDATLYSTPQPTVPEPVAYLTMDLDFARVSETFVDALGGLRNFRGLDDITSPAEREKVLDIRNRVYGEQKQREPNYLPPILGTGDQVLHRLGFTLEEVNRFELRHQDYLTFVTAGGVPRVYPVRLGLAKEGSFYFVVLLLGITPRELPNRSLHEHGHLGTRRVETSIDLASRSGPGVAARMQPMQSPGISPIGPSAYSASPNRAEFPGSGSYNTPRSEMPPGLHQPPRSAFQLPPIRHPLGRESSGGGQNWTQRDERSTRVDIEGLIEKPEGPGRSH